ncbi:MAG: tetratricopeptide repeat protein, partial [Burkholderiaceae bacterium]
QFNLGLMYAKGQGVAQDNSLAVSWYSKAAEQGYAHAQYYLGDMYANGRGVAKDSKQAAVLYRKAAKQGLAEAVAALELLDR